MRMPLLDVPMSMSPVPSSSVKAVAMTLFCREGSIPSQMSSMMRSPPDPNTYSPPISEDAHILDFESTNTTLKNRELSGRRNFLWMAMSVSWVEASIRYMPSPDEDTSTPLRPLASGTSSMT